MAPSVQCLGELRRPTLGNELRNCSACMDLIKSGKEFSPRLPLR